MATPNEERFEHHIELSLNQQGYKSLPYTDYDRDQCIIPDEVIGFIKTTQKEQYDRLFFQEGEGTDTQILKTLAAKIEERGLIDVLRKGIKTRGAHFELVYFQPKSGLNPDHQNLYKQNSFSLVRQLRYSKRNENSIDMVLFLNGIPLLTMELKNQLTGQNYKNSENQYKNDRDPNEPLLKFKRCLVHFCVDNDQVSMATKLSGQDTKFLPYNKGIENPKVDDEYGYRSEYLWKEILTPTSVLDIIENFVLVSKESKYEWNEKTGSVVEKKQDVLIFPRFHQLEVIRNLRDKIKEEGAGHYYLVQHSTGSGKSYSIGWLAHTLTSLYQSDADTRRIFDTILVITDRKVLDNQLKYTLKQLEQTQGVVNPVEIDSEQLQTFIEQGKDIIVSTIQKFPVISESIAKMKDRKFAVIVDEAHSSQSGETTKHLKLSLSKEQIAELTDEDGNIDYEELIMRDMLSRGRQSHLSFFGFTGTPKPKTIELFGRKNDEGRPVPFHIYSMKQSIHEEFTLDVLEHYTSYKRYFKIAQKVEGEDKELPKSSVMKAMVDYVDSHDIVIRQKVGIILKNFIANGSKKINGKGRAMVVVRSRKHCVLYFQEMKRQMIERNLGYSCLVAFSGSVSLDGQDYTEGQLNKGNGMLGNDIPLGFKDPRFRILIVSNKFQTGFDEPDLHSMYVDKKLNGVMAVQTLSRLNRNAKGKTDTFILDFVNDTDMIVEAFQTYYTTTELTGETDPDKLYDIQSEIEGYNLFTKAEVEEFVKLFYTPAETDERLQPILSEVVDRWKAMYTDDEKENFRSKVQSFIRLYSFISQIIKFQDKDWEKLFIFLKYLNKKLPKGTKTRPNILDAIDLNSLRIQMIGESRLSLEDKPGVMEAMDGSGYGGSQDEIIEPLSVIIAEVNKRYGIELTEEDRLDLQNVGKRLVKDEELKKYVVDGNNSETDRKKFFDDFINKIFIEYVNSRFDFYKKVEDPKVANYIKDGMYRQYRERMAAR